MDPIVAWITGIGSILAAGWGVVLIIREIRSKQNKEIHRLDEELQLTQEQLIDNHKYVFQLRAILADHGIETPEPPPVRRSNAS